MKLGLVQPAEGAFIVTNASGEQVAASPHIEEALMMLRLLPIAQEIVRESDGKTLAVKQRKKPKPENLVNVRLLGAA